MKTFQKFQSAYNESTFGLIASSISTMHEKLAQNIDTYRPESLKLQGIKYFRIADKISGFSKLQPNWDSYNADKISINALASALITLNVLNNQGLLSGDLRVSVFPMRDGGIQFEFDGENICAELEINQDEELTFILFDEDGNIVEKKKLFELSDLSTFLQEAQYA